MKKESGITLGKICICIVVVFIFICLIINIFINTNKKVELEKYVAKMELLQEKTNFVRSEYKLWENYNPNETGNFYTYLQELGFSNANDSSNIYIEEFKNIIEELNVSNLDYWNKNADSIITNYCFFSSDDLEVYFDLENTELDVIINFYTGNIISRQGIQDDKNIIHRQYDTDIGNELIVAQIYNNNIIPKLEVIENYGLEQKIKISISKDSANILQVYYYLDNENVDFKLCNNFKNYSYIPEENAVYFNIDNSGKYTFIIEDTNFVQYTQVAHEFNLCNEPYLLENMIGIYWDDNGEEKQINSKHDSKWYNYTKDNFKMANAKTEDGNYWVWIPRYIYKETTESVDIEFVSGITNIATNNKSMIGYKIQDAFSQNGEISGFWMAKYQGNIKDNKLNFRPGQTLSVYSAGSIKNDYKTFLDIGLRNCSDIMSENELEAILLLSEAIGNKTLNNLVHYAGGSPHEDGFKDNVQYSMSNNIYGIYDLLTSENEITKESKSNEEGRFRVVLKDIVREK